MSRPSTPRVTRKRLRLPQLTQISDMVRAGMLEQNVPVRVLAEQAGISETHFNKLLTGHRPWTLYILLQVASVLKLKVTGLPEQALPQLTGAIDSLRLQDRQLPRFSEFLQKLPRIRTIEHLQALSQVLEALALAGTLRTDSTDRTEVFAVNTSEGFARRGTHQISPYPPARLC